MNDLIITKPVIPDDISQIEEVFFRTWMASCPNDQIGITKEDIEEYFKDRGNPDQLAARVAHLSALPPNELFLVAKKSDQIIGVCRVIIRERVNQLQSIYVLPEYQGQGVGSVLWSNAYKFLDSAKETIVQVATYNEQAIAFYRSLGFVDTGRRFTEERHRMPKSGVFIPEMELKLTPRR